MRHHKTFAPSSIPRKRLCSFFESKPAGKAAERGTLQHTALEDLLKGRPVSVDLTDEEKNAVTYAYNVIYDVIEHEIGETYDAEKIHSEIEVDIFDEEMNQITFGTVDVAYGNMIFDYKSFMVRNFYEQMLCYAVGYGQLFGYDDVYVREIYGSAEYCKKPYRINVKEGLKELLEIKKEIESKTEPEVNEYCNWCKKRNKCKAFAGQLEVVSKEKSDIVFETLVPEKADNETLAKMKTFAAIVNDWSKEINDEMLKRLHDGQKIPGYFLKKSSGRKSITDITKAFELSLLPDESFINACTLSLPKIAKEIAKVEKVSQKAGRELAESRLLEVIELGKPAFSIASEK